VGRRGEAWHGVGQHISVKAPWALGSYQRWQKTNGIAHNALSARRGVQ